MAHLIGLLLFATLSFSPSIQDEGKSVIQILASSVPAQQQSDRPAPSPRKSKGNPPSKKPDQNPQAPKSDNAPSAEPLTNPQAPKGETIPANTPDKSEKKTTPDWLVWFTGALVLVGACQLIAMIVQAKWMRRTVGVAEESAKAATDTVKAMRDTAEKQLRAYVYVVSAGR